MVMDMAMRVMTMMTTTRFRMTVIAPEIQRTISVRVETLKIVTIIAI
jgi:hypothetical protein